MNRLPGDIKNGRGPKRTVELPIHSQFDLVRRGDGCLILSLGVKAGARNSVLCSSEVGNELRNRRSVRGAIIDARVVQRSGRDTVARIGIDGSEV